MSGINHEKDSLEDHPLFTPDLEYFTPLTTMSLDNTNAYCPRTLTPYNLARHTVLPAFPPSQPTTSKISKDVTNLDDIQAPPLLLCNVSSKTTR